MENLTARTLLHRAVKESDADVEHVDLDGRRLMVATPDGTEYEIRACADGHLEVSGHGGGTLFSRNTYSNVLQVVSWPTFQPFVPPTPEQPVLASREHVIATVGGSGGMSTEALGAAQREIDNDPAIKQLVEAAIHRAVTVRDGGYGHGTTIARTERGA